MAEPYRSPRRWLPVASVLVLALLCVGLAVVVWQTGRPVPVSPGEPREELLPPAAGLVRNFHHCHFLNRGLVEDDGVAGFVERYGCPHDLTVGIQVDTIEETHP